MLHRSRADSRNANRNWTNCNSEETDLARKIAQAHGEAFQADPWIDVTQVRKAIPQTAVLVDIARFQPFSFQSQGNQE